MKKKKKTYYQIAKEVESKLDNYPHYVESYSNYDYKTLCENVRLIATRIFILYDTSNDQLDEHLCELISYESFLHYIDKTHRNQRKAIINKIHKMITNIDKFVSADEMDLFFSPYFSDTFELSSTEYFLDFKKKWNDFYYFYKCISKDELWLFEYVTDDLKTFIECLYTRGPLPQRDYNKKYELLVNP